MDNINGSEKGEKSLLCMGNPSGPSGHLPYKAEEFCLRTDKLFAAIDFKSVATYQRGSMKMFFPTESRLRRDTVKDIQKSYLARHYGNPDFSGLEYIGIDEFAVSKGHVYKTIVVSLVNGHVVHIGDGKGKEALAGFWEKAKKAGVSIKAVATDLSSAFIASVMENAPQATLVFDHFHVVKLMNEVLDGVRRSAYREEKDLNKRKVIKGTRWLLLCDGKDVFDEGFKNRLENALKMNEPLMKVYYLKEALREIWAQINKEEAEKALDCWLQQAYQAKIPKLTAFANTLKAHKWGVLAWYDYHISTGKLEGINNKIKTMKRQAYGYRDQRFFELKIFAMHDKNYAFVG